jgi:hypothetical protein
VGLARDASRRSAGLFENVFIFWRLYPIALAPNRLAKATLLAGVSVGAEGNVNVNVQYV